MPPVLLVVARHSERVDHADPSWAATALRPHDAPITPGRGVALGVALGRHLFPAVARALLAADPAAAALVPGRCFDKFALTPSEAHRVLMALAEPDAGRLVLLASPLRRCVQTADAIADGLLLAAADAAGSVAAGAACPGGGPRIQLAAGLREGAFWMAYDLGKRRPERRLGPDTVPRPLLLPAAFLAATAGSARMVDAGAAGGAGTGGGDLQAGEALGTAEAAALVALLDLPATPPQPRAAVPAVPPLPLSETALSVEVETAVLRDAVDVADRCAAFGARIRGLAPPPPPSAGNSAPGATPTVVICIGHGQTTPPVAAGALGLDLRADEDAFGRMSDYTGFVAVGFPAGGPVQLQEPAGRFCHAHYETVTADA